MTQRIMSIPLSFKACERLRLSLGNAGTALMLLHPVIQPSTGICWQGLMRNRSGEGFMAEEPSVDAFMRHLQVCVEEARTIADGKEREQRLWQLESALQEAIIYKNRIEELQRHGIDPVRLVESESGITPAPAPKKVEALMTGTDHCPVCKAVFEPDLAFCPACGAEK